MQKQRDVFLSALCWEGVETGVYPGAAAVVACYRKKKWKKLVASCGHTQRGGKGVAVNEQTLFDLASLTKPLCTALGFIHLAGHTDLDLTKPLAELACCRTYPAQWQGIRLVDLLSHSSGLPAYREYFKSFAPVQSQENKEGLFGLIEQEPLEYATGSQCAYSDLGYIVLGRILEKLGGSGLDAFFSKKIAGPCGLAADIGFRPIRPIRVVQRENEQEENIAATEECPWRQRLLLGEVHDEHAWLMGGTAGHAGLFGRVEAVAELCMLLVDILQARAAHPNLESHLVRAALNYKTGAGLWALGFDRPTPGQSSSGDYFSACSVGHLGYAGTSFWIDLEREIVVVLLTNRVHPSRENRKIQQFRPYFHNRIMRKMI